MRKYTLLITCFLLGCSTIHPGNTNSKPVAALEPAAFLKFQDIPIPSGFIFNPENSYAFQNIGFRAGLLQYKGKASADQVVTFFKEQMPMYNWHLQNIVEHTLQMLSFEKDQETCIITIEGKGNNSQIILSVAPKSQNQSLPRRTEKALK